MGLVHAGILLQGKRISFFDLDIAMTWGTGSMRTKIGGA
jgi:hypothetical protein